MNQEQPGAREFRRDLTLLDSTMIVIGSMIGSGIFIVSADIARTVGSGGWLLMVWLAAGLLTVIAALCYGELAGLMPRAGGQYVYLREAYNPLVGFLYGWSLFLVIQTGTIAAVGMAFAKFTAIFFPGLGEGVVLASFAGLKFTAAQAVAIGCIVLLTAVNLRGIHGGKIVQNIFTITKIAALLGLIVLGIAFGMNSESFAKNLAGFWDASWTRAAGGTILSVERLSGLMIPAAAGVAMVGSLFSSDAWYDITFTADEVVNPKRTIPLSLALGTVSVTALYLLANFAYLLVLPVAGSPEAQDILGRGMAFAANDRIGTAAATALFGAPGAFVMGALIMVSTFGCNNGLILSGARVYWAMAKDGLFFRKTGHLNDRAVPGVALVIQAVWASLLCLSGTYGDLLDFVIFAALVFFALTVGGIFVLRKKRPDAERPWRVPGYPVLPALYILAAAAVSIDLLVFKPKYTWPGVIIVLLGIPVYFIWKRISDRRGGPGEE